MPRRRSARREPEILQRVVQIPGFEARISVDAVMRRPQAATSKSVKSNPPQIAAHFHHPQTKARTWPNS